MERRIMGLETEYGVMWLPADGRRILPDRLAACLQSPLAALGISLGTFLVNGARLYIDFGAHPEYATPECDDPVELVACDRAGERILAQLVQQAERTLHEQGHRGRLFVFKNNVDSHGHSYGCHENYSIERRHDFDRLADRLLPFLVTRQLIVGAGHVRTDEGHGTRYCFSQRSNVFEHGLGSGTTRNRAIISVHKESHADDEQYRRLHLIVGDSNMSEATTLLKVVSTDLVLRMIESGTVDLDDLVVEHPERYLDAVSTDMTGAAALTLADGRTMTALQLQQEYLRRAVRFVRQNGLLADDPGLAYALDLWGRTLVAIAEQDPSGIDTEIDWAIKDRTITDYRTRRNLPLSAPEVAQVALRYSDIDEGRGLYHLRARRGRIRKVLTDRQIRRASRRAPQTTRAKVRGDFVRHAQRAGRLGVVDWRKVSVTLANGQHHEIICNDPFAARDSRVDALRRRLGLSAREVGSRLPKVSPKGGRGGTGRAAAGERATTGAPRAR